MLAGAVDARKRLLVQQAHQTVALGNFLHHFHRQLIVVGCDGGDGKNRGKFVLRGGNFIVLGLGEDAQLPQLFVQIGHERLNARLNRTEIVVFQLLPLRRLVAEQGAAGENQVLALVVERLVNKEILLLRADGGGHARCVTAEELQHANCLRGQRLHRAQQRRLLVERFAAVGAERRRDAQHAVLDKGVAGGIPRRVATRLKRGAQTAGGERGSVRLAADEFLAAEFEDNLAAVLGRNEAVVLFSGDAGQGLKPVRIMRNAAFHCPVLHGICHDVGHLRVKGRTISDGFVQRLVNILGQTLLHDGVIENAAAEKLFDVGHPGFLLQSHFALESIPAAGESGSAFRRAPRKTRFFRIYEEKGNCENE